MSTVITTPSRLLLRPLGEAVATAQRQLQDAQLEASTSRRANMPLALGPAMGVDVSLRTQLSASIQDIGIIDQATVKASVFQAAFSELSGLADSFRSTLTGARNSFGGEQLAANTAASALTAMRETLNTAYDEQFLFGGLNGGIAPITNYHDGPRNIILSTFEAAFGFLPDNPAASTLTAAQVAEFLDGSFSNIFATDSWSSEWCHAATETSKTRLGSGETLDASASANAPFARKLAAAFSMIDILGQGTLGRAAFEAAVDKSLEIISEAQNDIISEQVRLGISESRLSRTSADLEAKQTRLKFSIQSLEGVDSYEAATRINTIMTQLETSYALTARISKMSLLSYI